MMTLYFDGLCMPKNPGGVATYGYVVYSGNKKVGEGFGFVGAGMLGDDVSNNVAEYHALLRGLEYILSTGYRGDLTVRGDSQLVIRQLSGAYTVKAKRLVGLHRRVSELLQQFRSVALEWVPREENSEADALSRIAFEEFVKKNHSEYMKFYFGC